MIATNEYLNNALILCCGHETDDIGILDRVTMIFTKLLVIMNTLLQGDVYDVPSLPKNDEINTDWTFHNYISLGLEQKLLQFSKCLVVLLHSVYE